MKTKKRKTIVVSKSKALVPSEQITTQDFIPEVNGKKLALTNPLFNQAQILHIFQRTPQKHIYSRPAKGGGTWDYVTAVYIKKVLNYVFGFRWDFEVVEHGQEKDSVWVLGKLTVYDTKGSKISKMQFGRADIKFKKNTRDMLDFGNDLKSATSDSLKKCASEFGIASDVYGKNEFNEIGVPVSDQPEKKQTIISTPQKYTQSIKVVQDTSLDVDYAGKLKAQVIKMNGNKGMTNNQILDFINKTIGVKLTKITSRASAQMLLAQLISKEK